MGSDLNILVWKWSKMPKKILILPYKTRWKPRFSMDTRPLVEGLVVNFGIFLDVFEFLRFGCFFFRFSNNLVFWVILVHPETLSNVLETSGQRAYHSF